MTRRRPILLLVMAVVAVCGSIESYRWVGAYHDLTGGRMALLAAEHTLTDVHTLSLPPGSLDPVQARLHDAQTRLRRASATLTADPVLWLLAQTPVLGKQVHAVTALAAMGGSLADAGVAAAAGLHAADTVRSATPGALSEQLVPVLAAVAPHAQAAERDIAAAKRQRHTIADGLLPPLRNAVVTFDARITTLDQLVAGYDQASTLAPVLLGYDRPRTYLVLAHDNSELLGAGGFVLVYGSLTFAQGKLSRVFFDNVANIPPSWPPPDPEHHVQPPAPLANYLLHGWPMGFAEASWWLDFPTESRAALDLYRINSGKDVAFDGVIGVNFFTLEALLRVIGPVTVERYGETVSADDVVEKTLLITNPEQPRPGEDPYAFTGDVAQAIIARTLSAGPEQWPALFETLGTLVRERNLALYSPDAATEAAVSSAGADGVLTPGDGDFLMVADSSVGTTKLNYVVRSTLDLDITLDTRGGATDSLMLAYSNPFTTATEGKPERLKAIYVGDKPFYFDYLRLYTPAGAVLQSAAIDGQRFDQADDPTMESGTTVFGRFFALPLDTSRTIRMSYTTPGVATVTGNALNYRLHLRKQPGSQVLPVNVMVHAPPGYMVTVAQLDGHQVMLQDGKLETDLRQDRELVVAFRRAG